MSYTKETISFKDQIKDYTGLSAVLWARLSDQPGQNPRQASVVVNTSKTYQTFKGTGGAFSEIGGKALFSLEDDHRQAVVKQLFHHEEAGFTNCRLPIGSSDFALSAYSLNDNPGDYDMSHFSLERDEAYIIPYIEAAQALANGLTIHGSPWTPPAWLKTNKAFVKGGSIVDDEKTYKAYALYLGKFINAYKDRGININRLLIQNEPDSPAVFPSCIMEPRQMAKFATQYLRPTFESMNVDAEIWAGTFRTITGLQADEFMSQLSDESDIDGVGFQYALCDHINDFTRSYPNTPIMHTETPCYNGENTWEQAIGLFNDFVGLMNAGCEVFSYWNMILDEKAESTWGWKQNSLVTIKDNKEVVYNPDFHIMRLLGHYIKPGAKRVQCMCMVKQAIAFKNPDGSTVVFICNLNDQDSQASINLDGSEHTLTLEGSTITVVKI